MSVEAAVRVLVVVLVLDLGLLVWAVIDRNPGNALLGLFLAAFTAYSLIQAKRRS